MSSTCLSLKSRAQSMIPRIVAASGMNQSEIARFEKSIHTLSKYGEYLSGASEIDIDYLEHKAATALHDEGYTNLPKGRLAARNRMFDESKVTQTAKDLERDVGTFVNSFKGVFSRMDLDDEKHGDLKREVWNLLADGCKARYRENDDRGSESRLVLD
ncbi:uncharacterized protein IL334_004651 [Kwoniella shivajii]|uniref:Uncharacterized protein n=1 Tax=Kwoniella shivajii TaxID=564305 RepID=A0ABZ1D2B7_9TREE|nr:hypothetical protein IL334_004651 [Kwoniella shivajii]